MKKELSMPVAIGAVVICVLVIAVVGWMFMRGQNRDKYGVDLSAPSRQPSNMADMMKERMNTSRGAGTAGGGTTAPAQGAGR